jgi:hypothetical protein
VPSVRLFGTDASHAGRYRRPVEEARRVLSRLRRIELLEREDAPAEAMLDEVRALLAEAEAWVTAEPGGTRRAEAALDRCRKALEPPFATAA